jgi:hypothetical protein
VTTRTRGTVAAVLLAALVALSACQGAADPKSDPTPTKAGGSASSSAAPSASGDASPTAASVEPATGDLVDLRSVRYHLPAGIPWSYGTTDRTIADYQENPGTRPFTIVANESTVLAGNPATLDYAASLVLRNKARFTHPLRRGADRTIDGVAGWTGTTTTGSRNDRALMWGTVRNGFFFNIALTGPDTAETRTMFESMLASIEWR